MNEPPEVPKPPRERREPLPWRSPKSIAEDPDAGSRVQAILNNPGYRQADQDIAFGRHGPEERIDMPKDDIMRQLGSQATQAARSEFHHVLEPDFRKRAAGATATPGPSP